MAKRIVSLVEASKKAAAQNSDGLRVACEAAGIALMKCGSYVASQVNGLGIGKAMQADRSTLKFESVESFMLFKGNKGAHAEWCFRSECGEFLKLGNDILHLSTGDILVLSKSEFAQMCLANGERFAVQSRDKRVFEGFCFADKWADGWKARQYSICAYALGGRVVFFNAETKENCYNKREGANGSALMAFVGTRNEVDVEALLVAMLDMGDEQSESGDENLATHDSTVSAEAKKALAKARRNEAKRKARAAKKAQG